MSFSFLSTGGELSENSMIIAIAKSDVLFQSKFHDSFKAKLPTETLVEVSYYYFFFCVVYMGRVDASGLNKYNMLSRSVGLRRNFQTAYFL